MIPAAASGSSTPTLSIVIPTLNEAANMGRVVTELETLVAERGPADIEVIVVDDGSKDGTPAQVEALMVNRPWLRLIRRAGRPDLSKSVVDGWRIAAGAWIGVMDGDLQHPGRTWRDMLIEIDSARTDFVVGSRFAAGANAAAHSFERTLISRLAIGAARFLLGSSLPELSDPMSGMFAVRRSQVSIDSLKPLGYKILLETVVRSRISRVREVPICFRSRKSGSSKAGAKVALQYGAQLLRLWGFLALGGAAQVCDPVPLPDESIEEV